MRSHVIIALAVALGLGGGCGETGDGGEPPPPRPEIDFDALPYENLSEYGFFVGEMVDGIPTTGVIPYTVAAPLWADEAGKGRYMLLPEDSTATITDLDAWEYPVDTIFIKSFFVELDRANPGTDIATVETRLLVLAEDGWHSYIYRWNDEQTEATRIRAGADLYIPYTDAQGQSAEQIYIIPDENTCGECHERDDVLGLLGPTSAQLNMPVERDGEMVDQIAWLAEQGVVQAPGDLGGLNALPDPAGDADLDARARAYLHGNCAHCHRPGGGGGASGLKFMWWETDPAEYGVCKVPAAAGPGAGGRAFDIVPGHPEDSIVPFRMASEDPEIKMPELPSLLADDFGVDLITEWIAAMPERDCTAG